MAYYSPDEPTWRLIYGENPQFSKPETRVYMNNIPSNLTQGQLAHKLRSIYGPVQIHYFSHGDHDDGYAWVGFEEEAAVRKAIREGSPKMAPAESPKEPKVAKEL